MRPRRWGRVLVLGAALYGLSAVGAGPASAAVSCDGAGCRGVNPQRSVCVWDARVIAGRGVPGVGIVQLVYSPRCHASWSRTVTNGTYHRTWVTEAGGYSQATGAYHPDFSSWSGGQYYMWSPMVNGWVTNCGGYTDPYGRWVMTPCL